ncbi:helix-turn-helix transcriptional regulator [Inhella sp.]|uniref:helix-turn-helix transcriptional regulator n=1 Tax=Inhella sp. TaxID=1921806 RepID=UPI0035B35A75
MSFPDRLLTKAEVAELLRCSERTIERRVKLGEFPPSLRNGKETLWFESVVHAWLARCQAVQLQWLTERAHPLVPPLAERVETSPEEAKLLPAAPTPPKPAPRRAKEWVGAQRSKPLFQSV